MANSKTIKTVKFAIDELSRFKNDNNKDLAVGRMLFLSTRPNTHNLKISEEVLKKYAPTIKGKWIVAEYDKWFGDVTTHTPEQVIQGIVPYNAEVEFVRADDGYLDAYVDFVISKLYSTDVYDIFLKDNQRSVSVEMVTDVDPEVGGEVSYLNIFATSILGKRVNPSVPNAHMNITKFSEKDANDYYTSLWADIDNKENLVTMADKSYKIDKSKEAMSTDDWSSVDKTKLRNTILEAKNKAELVNAVYLKVENGWQDAPSEKLGYPVMQLKNNTFVYNRNALANAKARAVQQNETEVLNKLNSIYKKLELDETDNKGEDKMAKLEDNKANNPTEDKQVELSDKKEQQDTNIVMGDGKSAECADDDTKKTECADCGDKSAKMEDDKNNDKHDDDHDDKDNDKNDDKHDDDKDADMSAKCAELEAKLAEKEVALSEKDSKIAEYETELSELRQFKSNVEESQKMEVVTATLAQVKDYMSDEKYSEYSESGKACKFADITAWKNEVLANVTTDILNAKMSEKDTDHINMSFPQVETKNGLWD